MLNKIKKQVFPMLETLGEALGHYFDSTADGLREDISQFIDAITAPLAGENEGLIFMAELLKKSLVKPEF